MCAPLAKLLPLLLLALPLTADIAATAEPCPITHEPSKFTRDACIPIGGDDCSRPGFKGGYCPPGFKCAPEGKCIPLSSAACAKWPNLACPAGTLCHPYVESCLKSGHIPCRTGGGCPIGWVCSTRGGKSTCARGGRGTINCAAVGRPEQNCWAGDTCHPTAPACVAAGSMPCPGPEGDSCPRGYICSKAGNKWDCVTPGGGHGNASCAMFNRPNESCGPGWKCHPNGPGCIPLDSVPCGTKGYCRVPKFCQGDQCVDPRPR